MSDTHTGKLLMDNETLSLQLDQARKDIAELVEALRKVKREIILQATEPAIPACWDIIDEAINKQQELKSCPFCGQDAYLKSDYAMCHNLTCWIYGKTMPVSAWNTRTALEQPTNDYVRMRLAQIASGDYKTCGHTAEQIAADALLYLAKHPTNDVERVADAIHEECRKVPTIYFLGLQERERLARAAIAALTQKNEGL